MKLLKKIITLFCLYVLTFVFVKVTIVNYAESWLDNKNMLYFAIGVVASLILYFLFLRKNHFYGTLRHELCHWFFALISFKKPQALHISSSGVGSYAYAGLESNYLIVLAPYFFPLISILLLVLQLFFIGPRVPFYVVMGMAMAFDLVSMKQDYHLEQSDWKKYGRVFSIQFSMLLLLFFTLNALLILFNGYQVYPQLAVQIYESLIKMAQHVWTLISQ